MPLDLLPERIALAHQFAADVEDETLDEVVCEAELRAVTWPLDKALGEALDRLEAAESRIAKLEAQLAAPTATVVDRFTDDFMRDDLL